MKINGFTEQFVKDGILPDTYSITLERNGKLEEMRPEVVQLFGTIENLTEVQATEWIKKIVLCSISWKLENRGCKCWMTDWLLGIRQPNGQILTYSIKPNGDNRNPESTGVFKWI